MTGAHGEHGCKGDCGRARKEKRRFSLLRDRDIIMTKMREKQEEERSSGEASNGHEEHGPGHRQSLMDHDEKLPEAAGLCVVAGRSCEP